MEFTYKEIKESYLEIKSFLKLSKKENKKLNLNTKIEEDLDFWGDDNYFMLLEYIEKYKVNFDKFDYDTHFYSEGELLDFRTLILGTLFLPISGLAAIHDYFYPKKRIDFQIPFTKKEPRADLTFGDLVASKLKGEFCLKADANIQLKKEK